MVSVCHGVVVVTALPSQRYRHRRIGEGVAERGVRVSRSRVGYTLSADAYECTAPTWCDIPPHRIPQVLVANRRRRPPTPAAVRHTPAVFAAVGSQRTAVVAAVSYITARPAQLNFRTVISNVSRSKIGA